MVRLQVGEERRPRRRCCGGSSRSSTPATTWPSPAARSGSAATPSRSSRSTRSSRSASSSSATRSSGSMTLHPLTGEVVTRGRPSCTSSRRPTTSPARSGWSGRSRASRPSSRSSSPTFERQGKLLEAQRLRMRTTYDIEMMRQVGFCSGIENYSMHIDGRAPRLGAQLPARLLPRGLPARRRRVARHRAADRRHVRGRHVAQAQPRRPRLPAAERDGQPAAAAGRSSSTGSARPSTSRPRPGNYELDKVGGDVVEQIIRPTGLIDPEVVVKPTKGQIDDLIHEIRVRAEQERARARHHADQEDVRGPHRLPPRRRHPRPLPALRDRHPRAASSCCASCGWASTTSWSASTCSARASTCPRSRSSRSSTPTRRASCARDKSLIQTIGRAARNVSGQVHMYADKITAVDGAGDRRDQPAPREAGRLQHSSTASTRSRCARRSPTSPRCSPREDETPRSCCGPGRAQVRGARPTAPAGWPGGPLRRHVDAAPSARRRSSRRSELAELIQAAHRPDARTPPPSCSSSSRPGCATRSPTSRRSCGR